jgi:hypothetical protein
MFNRNKPQKQAEEIAAKEEADRLAALPPADLAVEILPAFGPEGPGKGKNSIGTFQIGLYLLRNDPRGKSYMKQLLQPIREATQALEHASLVEIRATDNTGVAARARATRLGAEALEKGDAGRYLAA